MHRAIPMAAAIAISAAFADEQPQELGRIRWQRDFAAAQAAAKQADRPLLVLFDEVPG